MPIGTAGNPHFGDFANQKEAPTTETHHMSAAIHQVRKAPLTADSSGELNLTLDKRLRGSGNGGFSRAKRIFAFHKSENRRKKRWLGPWVIIGRFRNKFSLVRLRGSYLEVGLDDMRSENRLLEVIGADMGVTTPFTDR